MKRNSKTDRRKVATFLATLVIIALPIAQLNVYAFTNGVPADQVVEKLGARTLAKFVGDDTWGSTATGGAVLPAGGISPSTNAHDQESPAQSTDGEKQDDKKGAESKNKDEKTNESNSENEVSSSSNSSQKNSSNAKASSNSNPTSSSNSSSSSNSGSNSGSNSNSNSGSNTNTNTDSSDTKPEPTGHWKQKLVKEAWTETVTVTQYRCMCGQIFDSPEAWQAHRPNP